MSTKEYKNNHYVPKWYQKRFLPKDQVDQELYYLSLEDRYFTDSNGIRHKINPVRKQGFKFCFAEEDLYELRFGEQVYNNIEKDFFGNIDNRAPRALDYFENFKQPSMNNNAFNDLLAHMSVQKLRTLKGLDWLSSRIDLKDNNRVLQYMLGLKDMHRALWMECVWQIADARDSATKFIVTDHPVTVYNKMCGPRNREYCRGSNDPDIALVGTHTIYPLSLNKVLIFTNTSWVWNPHQSAIKPRPNPNKFRGAIFKWTDIQMERFLSEQEVLEINFILKSRAYRFIAASQEEWLYPEKYVSKSDWTTYGQGYLLMPDPRGVEYGGDILIGYKDGSATAFDAFGRRPWEKDYKKESNTKGDFKNFYRFKGEFATLFGRKRRGRSFGMAQLDPEEDTANMHDYHLCLYKKKK